MRQIEFNGLFLSRANLTLDLNRRITNGTEVIPKPRDRPSCRVTESRGALALSRVREAGVNELFVLWGTLGNGRFSKQIYQVTPNEM